MAAGHLLMGVQEGEYLGFLTISTEMAETLFFGALALLILGNGFFKPNISTIVGSLYPKGSPKRDGGFTLFYIGINLGAAMAPLLCGYIGETYGWHYGFGLATVGMLVGLAVFILPTILTQAVIVAGAGAASWAMAEYLPDDPAARVLNYFVAGALLIALIHSGRSSDRRA